ncbi:MAG TPA: hypothetical protein VFP80_17045 [Thermoanaerobaculia bacterium]|nr:hypothetical protein [Thermoanaerobaculia bacterium]
MSALILDERLARIPPSSRGVAGGMSALMAMSPLMPLAGAR